MMFCCKCTDGVDFSKALYSFDIGQNDLTVGFIFTTEEEVKDDIPNIIDKFTSVIQVSRHSFHYKNELPTVKGWSNKHYILTF